MRESGVKTRTGVLKNTPRNLCQGKSPRENCFLEITTWKEVKVDHDYIRPNSGCLRLELNFPVTRT